MHDKMCRTAGSGNGRTEGLAIDFVPFHVIVLEEHLFRSETTSHDEDGRSELVLFRCETKTPHTIFQSDA